jgi:hypothetical protein
MPDGFNYNTTLQKDSDITLLVTANRGRGVAARERRDTRQPGIVNSPRACFRDIVTNNRAKPNLTHHDRSIEMSLLFRVAGAAAGKCNVDAMPLLQFDGDAGE